MPDPQPPDESESVTPLLNSAARGDKAAAQELYRRVHDVLHRIARQRMRRERGDHTLEPTALVHEAWLKLVGDRPVEWSGRAQFYGAAADAMRHILIDYARQRGRAKRGGDRQRLPINVADLAARDNAEDILAVNDAIARLEAEEPDVGAVVRLRFFAGLTVDETAAALGQSSRQVDRLWTYARAWLFRMLSSEDH